MGSLPHINLNPGHPRTRTVHRDKQINLQAKLNGLEKEYGAYLYTFFFEVHFQCQLFAQHNVWVVCFIKCRFKLLQLLLREDGAMAALSFRWWPMTDMATVMMWQRCVRCMSLHLSRSSHMSNSRCMHILWIEIRICSNCKTIENLQKKTLNFNCKRLENKLCILNKIRYATWKWECMNYGIFKTKRKRNPNKLNVIKTKRKIWVIIKCNSNFPTPIMNKNMAASKAN